MILIHISNSCADDGDEDDDDHRSVKMPNIMTSVFHASDSKEIRPAIKTTATKQRTWTSLAHTTHRITILIRTVDEIEEVNREPRRQQQQQQQQNRAYNFVVFSHRIRNIVVPFTQEVAKSISRAMRRRRTTNNNHTKKKRLVCICVCICFLIR